MVDVRSVYSTPAQTNGLSILMRKDGLTVANRVTVSSLAAAGTYAINFTCPSAGTFQLYTELNGIVIGKLSLDCHCNGSRGSRPKFDGSLGDTCVSFWPD
jgi:hypothetical protein